MAPAGVPMTGLSSSTPTVSVPLEVSVPSDTLTTMPNDLTSSLVVSGWSTGPDRVTV